MITVHILYDKIPPPLLILMPKFRGLLERCRKFINLKFHQHASHAADGNKNNVSRKRHRTFSLCFFTSLPHHCLHIMLQFGKCFAILRKFPTVFVTGNLLPTCYWLDWSCSLRSFVELGFALVVNNILGEARSFILIFNDCHRKLGNFI